MKTTIKTIMAIVFAFTIALTGCKKDAGPKGDKGDKGDAGVNGTNGTNGTNGNANVIASTTFTLNNWTSNFDDGINFNYSASASWAGITQAIVDKGVVVVYFDDGSGGWVALPYSYAEDTYSSTTINFSFSVGMVAVEYTGFDDSGSFGASALNGLLAIRIVAISASNREAYPNVNWSNYNEVKAVLNLKD